MVAPHALLSLVLSSLPWQSPQSSVIAPSYTAATIDKPDVVLITVDALRADRLGAYGYDKGTSPNLDAFAAQSLVFERAYAPMPSTSYSITSLMIGGHAQAIALESTIDSYPTLADRFRGQGYETVALYPPAVHFSAPPAFDGIRARHFGFAHVVCDALPEDRDAVERTDTAIEFLQENRERPVFLWAHYFAPHEPYVHHDDVVDPGGPARTESERYDGEVRWVDREIGRLLDYIKAERPRSIVVVTADHGEEFGERGGAYHGTSLFEEQIRVPLLIHVPELPARREAHPVSTAELPGIIDRVLATQPVGHVSSVPMAIAKPVFAELGTLKAAMLGRDKAICDLWTGHCRLYDLAEDPKERNDLASKQSRKVRHLRSLIVDWVAANPGRGSPALVPSARIERALRRARRGDRSANPALISLVADRRAGAAARTEAAKHLASTSRLTDRAALRRLWPTEAVAVNRWLAGALARVGDLRARTWLLDMDPAQTTNDPELLVRRAVVLASPNDSLAVSRIAEALRVTANDALRCQLMTSLGRVGSKEAAGLLTSSYEDVRTRFCAAEALVQIEDAAVARFALAKLRDEPYSNVRAILVKVIARAHDVALRADLEAIQATEREPIVSAAVTAALSAILESRAADL